MSYGKSRETRKSQGSKGPALDYTWEEENIKLLHSGFTESVPGRDDRSVLSVQLYFSDGRYWCRVTDREVQEQFFTPLSGLKNFAVELNQVLQEDVTVWRKCRGSDAGSYGH